MDHNGSITQDEIKTAFTKFGKDISDDELKEIMRLYDTNDDKVISKKEFKRIFE